MKYFAPSWQLTKRAVLELIKRDAFPVVQAEEWGDVLYLKIDEHNPFVIADDYYSLDCLIRISEGFRETFSNVKPIKAKVVKTKGFHKEVFFNIISSSAYQDGYNGWFYILKCEGYYKVGITQDYDKRKRTYKTENPFPLQEVFAYKIYCANEVEKYLKKAFRHQNHRGEWFTFSKRDLKFIIAALRNIINYN